MFNLGRLVMTATVASFIESNHKFAEETKTALLRYSFYDWGELCDEDKALNDSAVLSGEARILAKYATSEGNVYIITEWDRSVTTILFTEEY